MRAGLLHAQVLTAGGGSGFGGGVPALADAELYDPLARTWSTVASMSVPRVEHQVVTVAA